MEQSLFGRGLELMVFGMGTVMVFLTLLVFAAGIMSKLVKRYFPESEPEPLAVSSTSQPIRAPAEDQQLMAVITAAVHRYRSRH